MIPNDNYRYIFRYEARHSQKYRILTHQEQH